MMRTALHTPTVMMFTHSAVTDSAICEVGDAGTYSAFKSVILLLGAMNQVRMILLLAFFPCGAVHHGDIAEV